MEFQDKVVIITGAAGGIGQAVSKLFIENGAKLTLVDVNKDSLQELVESLNLDEKNYLIEVADVSKEEEVKRYVEATLNKYGKIDIFINNAGVEGKVQNIVDTTAENLDFVLGVNIKGIYFGLKHVMAVMMKQKEGCIINTSSVAGFIGSPGLGPYTASKHAVIGLTKTACLEGASYNIRVNAICPGPVENRMMRSIEEGTIPGEAEKVKNETIKSIPLQRYATNEEVADLMYFLASKRAKYINGVSYRIDGGMGAK
jgi:NAD(P)-dependent dehydrogenase (short-subunit alcohol dehydrogenase family)